MYALEATRLFYEAYTILSIYGENELKVIVETKNYNEPLVVTARRDAQKEMSRVLIRYLEMMDSHETYYVEQLLWTGDWKDIQTGLDTSDILFLGYLDIFSGYLHIWRIQSIQYTPKAPWDTPCLPMGWRITTSKQTANISDFKDYYTSTDRHILQPLVLCENPEYKFPVVKSLVN